MVEFPKYTFQLMNLATQNARSTRPAVVGQLSEMIRRFPGKTLEEWLAYYNSQQAQAIDDAVGRVWEMVQHLRDPLEKIDEAMVRAWVHDLVVTKTFVGLRFQEAILRAIAGERRETWQLAGPEDEAKGIDGYIGDKPVSIKPRSYDVKAALSESLPSQLVYYEKKRGGLSVTWE
ncbi:MAG: restriction endonuclease, partial [Armatimonadota bacterium]